MAKRRPRPAARARPRRRAAAPSTPRVRRKACRPDGHHHSNRDVCRPGRGEGARARTALERLAEEWTYILRSRTRWADDADLRQSFRGRALDDLERVGVPRTFMKKLASASHVEVELHGWDPADAVVNRLHEAAAEVPWEYLLSAGTRGVGRYRSMLITTAVPQSRRSGYRRAAAAGAVHRERARPAGGRIRLRVGARSHPAPRSAPTTTTATRTTGRTSRWRFPRPRSSAT